MKKKTDNSIELDLATDGLELVCWPNTLLQFIGEMHQVAAYGYLVHSLR